MKTDACCPEDPYSSKVDTNYLPVARRRRWRRRRGRRRRRRRRSVTS
jgi:hypothetical protein